MKFSIKIILCVFLLSNLAYAQTASILPPAKTTFLDQNGKPLTSGTVDFYIPVTTTRKPTWQDAGETILNTNPVVLDAAGRALILGSGSYRQVVKDRLGNLIWDQVTTSTGSGGSVSPTATGDGDLVGTIKPWAGLVAPNQYMLTYGQEISRTTYSVLLTSITSSQAVFCSSGSPVLTGLSDTTFIPIGSSLEASCLASGNSTVISKTVSTVTLASNASITTNITALILPWGGGNHTTTFNLPDFRGIVPAGNNIMGGVASSNLVTNGSYVPNAINAVTGTQFTSLSTVNLPPYTPSGTVTNGAITSTFTGLSGQTGLTGSGGAQAYNSGGFASSQITGTVASSQAASTFTGSAQGGTSTLFQIMQPTKTANFIIKVTPDTNSATASGVTSLGSMTGDIACGVNLSCTGNTISAVISPTFPSTVTVPSAGTIPRNISDWAKDDPYIEDFGGGVGVADNTAALNLAIANAPTSYGVRFRAGGTYNFLTQPNCSTNLFRVTGMSDTTQAAVLVRNFNQATPTKGFLCMTAGELNVANVFIQNGVGFTGGAAISMIPTTGSQGSLTNVRITNLGAGANQWAYSLYMDGSAIAASTALRTVIFKNVVLFGASIRSALIKSVIHFGWYGGSVNGAGGTDGSLELTGTALAPSSENVISLDFVFNNLILDYFSQSNINIGEVGGGITNTSNTSGIVGTGKVDSGTQANWTASSWMNGATLNLASGNVINWAAFDVTITHGSHSLTFQGASSGAYAFDNTVYPLTNSAGALGTSTLGWRSLFLAGSSSGISQLIAPAVATTFLWTLPSASDTLVGRATTDTFTNKSISGSTNTLSNIGNSSLTNSATTVNGQTCTLGSSCTVTATASSILTFGTHLTSGGASYNGSTPITITSDATNANTISTIVARDGSGNFSAGTITAALTGNASTATSATTATNATNTAITDDLATNATMFPTWVTANTGNLPQKTTSTKLTFNPSSGVLSSTSFTGAGTGLTGTAAGLTAGNVTNNANLTGAITSTGNATLLGSFTSANLLTALTDETGSGSSVFQTSPILNTVDARGVWTTGTSWTLPAHTLAGTISGGGNQLNNIIIGTSTPLAGAFTTVTANSYNKMAVTAPATSSTLAVADGKTFTASNTMTITSTDGVTIPFATWTNTTPTPSSSGGACTGATTNVDYQIQDKKVFVIGQINLGSTFGGTCTGSILLTLPFTAATRVTFGGKDVGTGPMFAGDYQNTTLTITKYDNTSPIAVNGIFPFSFISKL